MRATIFFVFSFFKKTLSFLKISSTKKYVTKMVNVPKKADVKRAENSLNPKNLTTMEVRYMLAGVL